MDLVRTAGTACALWLAAACGDDPGHVHDGDHAQPPGDCPADLPEFRADPDDGYEVQGELALLQARVIDASDVPPRLNGNDWTILITDADGMPLEDAEIAQACAHMPDHTHAEPPREVIAGAQPGEFTLEFLNLNMTGYWEVQVAVSAPSLAGGPQQMTLCGRDRRHLGDDMLVLRACIPR
jgi:hypothetical protein